MVSCDKYDRRSSSLFAKLTHAVVWELEFRDEQYRSSASHSDPDILIKLYLNR